MDDILQEISPCKGIFRPITYQENDMYCSKCGHLANDHETYCPICGTPLRTTGPSHPEYQKLGGWLLLFTLQCVYIIVYFIRTLIIFAFIADYDSDIMMSLCIALIPAILCSFVILIAVLLRFKSIVTIYMISALITVIFMFIGANQILPPITNGILIIYLFPPIIIWAAYFWKSERVKVYFNL